jgi:hypothetical protein
MIRFPWATRLAREHARFRRTTMRCWYALEREIPGCRPYFRGSFIPSVSGTHLFEMEAWTLFSRTPNHLNLTLNQNFLNGDFRSNGLGNGHCRTRLMRRIFIRKLARSFNFRVYPVLRSRLAPNSSRFLMRSIFVLWVLSPHFLGIFYFAALRSSLAKRQGLACFVSADRGNGRRTSLCLARP